MFPLKLFLFGSPRLERESETIHISLRKALALLAYLAMTNQSHNRDSLALLFWPEDDQSKARGNLRRALSRINRALGKGYLVADRETAGLDPEAGLWLDVEEFQSCLARCQSHDHPENEVCSDCLPLLTEAAELYTDEFLAGFSLPDCPDLDEWQFFQSDGLRQALASTLERLVHGLSEQGNYDAAVPHARRWLTLDPLYEPAQRRLMELYTHTGQQAAALRQYQECVRVLDEELGIPPSSETTALYEAIKVKQFPRPEAEKRESQKIGEKLPPHNLPPQPTPFIGREQEMAALDELVATPNVRLLTILGSGGIGKTRLALEMGATQLSRFDQGVYFVPLAPIDQTEDIVPAIAEALDFSFYEGGSPQQQILDYLREKEMLLILDNLEHLLNASESGDGVSQLITAILRTAPDVKIIATSRESLKLQEEQRFPISGIDVPPFDRADDAAAYGAIRLFEQSARRVRPDFELTGENAEFVVRICQLVEGMPLAILLAAAWVELLSPQDIVTEIGRSLDFLETDLRNIPARQRSMRAIFDHSWQLLTEQEQVVFQQIAIFRGGFTKTAVQAVTGASLRVLMALVNKSLIYRASEDHYDIHELLRQFVAEKLAEQGLESAVRDRHSAYYCAFLYQQEDDLKGPRHQIALTEIEAELENIKAAWTWAAGQGYVEHLGQAIFALTDFYYWRVRWQEGERLCRLATESLASITSEDGIRVRAKALTEQSRFNFMLGRFTVARECQRQGLTLLEGLTAAGRDVRAEKAYTLWIMGETEWYNPAKAVALFKEGLALNKPLGNDWLTAQLLRELGNAASISSNFDQAQALIEESLAVCQALGYRQGMASALTCLAYNALPQGQFEEATRLAREILKIEREFGDRRSLARGFLSAGMILTWAGEFAAGQTMLAECLPIYSDQGARSNIALVHAWLGYGNCHLGDYEQARSQIEHALALYQKIGQQEAITRWFLSQTLLALDRYDEALVVLQKSVPEFQATGQRNEWGLVLGTLGYTLYKLGNLAQARKHLAEALQLGVEIRAFMPLYAALPVISLFLADQGEIERAVELYALISRYPPVAKSRWFADTFGQHIEAVTATLPPGVAAAAQTRGRSREIWEAAEALLSDINLELTSSATPPPVHNLPLQPTPFIGREQELAALNHLIAKPEVRLITIVGPGGMGKTRLALASAERQFETGRFPNGNYFINLAPLSSDEFLISAIIDALNITVYGATDPKTQLFNYLQNKESLLVLDNFEHVLDGAVVLSEMTLAAPSVKLLVTSRERLNLQEEWVYGLQGMAFPETNADQTSKVSKTFEVLENDYSALQLFEERARQAQATFDLATEYPAVVRICQLVDGMPLGLELAASWINFMSCREIALEIEQNLDFLTTSLRNVPERHRSLRAVFEHSWQLLSNEEKEVFKKLSVFRGGFTRSAAESITGATLHTLMALVNKSLIQPYYTGRYHIHELLRQFGAEKLAEAGETETTRDRHLIFFLKLAEEAEPHLLGSDQATWLNRLELEHANLRAAVDWSRTTESTAEFSLRLTGSLALFWNRRSYMSEGRVYLSGALSRPEASPRTAARAKALHAAGLLAYIQSDYPATRPLLEESISIYRELDPTGRRGLADALITLGDMETGVGDYATAASLMEEALGIMRELKDVKGIARALWQLGSCAVRLGDHKQAVQYLEEALPLCKQVGDKNNLATVLSVMAEVAARQGDYEHATELEEESLALRRNIGTNWGIAVSLGNFAWIALRRGDLKQAVTLLEESLTLRREIEDAGGTAWCLEKLAEIAVTKGQRESSSRRDEDFQRAARLFGAAEALRAPVNSAIDLADRPEYERQVALVRAHLDEATFAMAWAEGQAVDYVPSLLEFPAI